VSTNGDSAFILEQNLLAFRDLTWTRGSDSNQRAARAVEVWAEKFGIPAESGELVRRLTHLNNLADEVRSATRSGYPAHIPRVNASLDKFEAGLLLLNTTAAEYWENIAGENLTGQLALLSDLLHTTDDLHLVVTDTDALLDAVLEVLDMVESATDLPAAVRNEAVSRLNGLIDFLIDPQTQSTALLRRLLESAAARVFGDPQLATDLMKSKAGRAFASVIVAGAGAVGVYQWVKDDAPALPQPNPVVMMCLQSDAKEPLAIEAAPEPKQLTSGDESDGPTEG